MSTLAIATLVLVTQVARADVIRHDVVRQSWRTSISIRLEHARANASMNAVGPACDDFLREGRAARVLGLDAATYRAWRRGRASLTPEQGERAARVLNAAAWWLLGWDILCRSYACAMDDQVRGQVRPEVLAQIGSKKDA